MTHRYLTCFGETKTLTEWAKEKGIRVDTLVWRLDKSHLSPEEALTRPVMKKKASVSKDMTDFTNRNRSTYIDPTSALGLSGKNARPGEIWTSRRNDDEYLVIKNHGDYCNTLLLKEDGGIGTIEVQSRAKMYTNPGMMAYCFHTHMGEYVKTMPAMEFKKIIDTICKELDLSFVNTFVADEYEDRIRELNKCLQATQGEMEKAKAEIDILQKTEDAYKDQVGAFNKKLSVVSDEARKAKEEIDFLRKKLKEAETKPAANSSIEMDVLRLQAQTYKQMYDELLERIIGKRAVL